MHIVFTIIVAVVLGKWIIDRNKRKKEEAEASAGKPSEASAEETSGPSAEPSADQPSCTPQDILKALGCDILEHEDSYYFIGYQGGYFGLWFHESGKWLDMSYDRFVQYENRYVSNAIVVSNTVNLELVGWGCHIHMLKDEAEERPIVPCLMYRLALTGTSGQIALRIKELLPQAFMVSRFFMDKMSEEVKSGTAKDEAFFENALFRQKVERASLLKEMGHSDGLKEEQPESSSLTIPVFLDQFEDTEFGCLQRMKLVQGEQVKCYTDVSEITSFDIRTYIRSQEDPASVCDLTLFYEFEHQTMVVCLLKASCSTDKWLFYSMNIVRSGADSDLMDSRHTADGFRTMVEVRLTDAEADYWEAKFMIDDALDKKNSGKEKELTDEQRLLLSFTDADMQGDLYWAKKFYNNGCYYQALFYFKRVFNHLIDQWNQLDKDYQERFFLIAYYIGFIYMELGMQDRAFYYLFHARQANGLAAVQEFANCLCNMKDPGALSFIKGTIGHVLEVLNKQDGEEEDESLMSFYQFLNRRMAYVLIDRKEYDEAESVLNRMIAEGTDVEFAKSELEYLRKIREITGKQE